MAGSVQSIAPDVGAATTDETSGLPPRDSWKALKLGMRRRCPACGQAPLLHHYLKVADECPACGEEFHHHRADDFPAYITIFVVGHVLVAALLLVDEIWPDLPMSVHYLIWPSLVVVLCLWLLPIFKSMLVAYQWALRMHGFETAHKGGGPDAREFVPERFVA